VIPWENLERAKAPGGAELSLHRRGDEYVIRVAGADLMSNRMHGSEDALAALGCADLGAHPDARVLIGGLGMGYTLRAALDLLGPSAKVDVAELVPAVIAWNRGVLAPLAGSPLDDPRTRVEAVDVVAAIADARDYYDAILLDVDNGPDALTSPSNARLYGMNGLTRIRGALRRGGVLAVWSVADDVRFTERMARAGYEVRVERVLARHNARRPGGKRHVIWIARRRD
jgi:spermidine synthase